jgi:hypothetical protein
MKTTILILSFFLATSCNNDDDNQIDQSTPINFTDISKGELFNGNYNPTQHGVVFDNEDDWNNFKNNIWQIASFPPESDIDFDQDIVLAVFDEPRPTGGHSIDIISVMDNGQNIVVTYDKLMNGDDTTIPTRPYHFVKIPITSKPIEFVNN